MTQSSSPIALMDTVRAVAQRGLTYAKDPYDRERYETLMEAVAKSYGDLVDLDSAQVRKRFEADLGYPTAKVGADAAVFADGAILLIRRADSHKWALPGGWVDPGESPENTAARETAEETGLAVEPVQVIAVHTQLADPDRGPHSSVHILVLCRAQTDADEPQPTSEAVEVSYQDPASISDWHGDHGTWARAAMQWLHEHGDGGK